MVTQIMRLSNPRADEAGGVFMFTLETTEGDAEMALPTSDIGKVLQFFASLLVHLEGDVDGAPTNELFPVPCHGIGFQEGATRDTKLMVVKIADYGLAFEIENSDLASMGDELSRVARALSAEANRPH